MLEKELYEFFAFHCEWIYFWIVVFFMYSLAIVAKTYYMAPAAPAAALITHKENIFFEELPGLSFIILHSFLFYNAPSIFEKLLFIYWGPGYFVVAAMVLSKYPFRWKRIATLSSVFCKSIYVIIVSILLYYQQYMPIYTYSVWIMQDQVKLAWLKNNGDRTRRTTEDYWLVRICYPGFLFLPFVCDFYYSKTCMLLSVLILISWIAGIARLLRLGIFYVQPKIDGFGRDIVYL